MLVFTRRRNVIPHYGRLRGPLVPARQGKFTESVAIFELAVVVVVLRFGDISLFITPEKIV
jgi:hypothetical protein